ncbi:MAG: hypothetical protein HQL52_05360 [Magnetococcales bacterium]|nr:hypothetical protein [Magnetococcales bacterium]
MNITTAANFLIDRAVEVATGLDHKGRDNAQSSVRGGAVDKYAQAKKNTQPIQSNTGAYRVTISKAALQRLEMAGMAHSV